MPAIEDPIEFELFKNSIFSIADEMAVTITRTTYSGVLKDNMDFSTAFADADGKMIPNWEPPEILDRALRRIRVAQQEPSGETD